MDQSVKEMEKCMVPSQANDVALKHHTFDNRRRKGGTRATGSRGVQFELDNKESLTSLIVVICYFET